MLFIPMIKCLASVAESSEVVCGPIKDVLNCSHVGQNLLIRQVQIPRFENALLRFKSLYFLGTGSLPNLTASHCHPRLLPFSFSLHLTSLTHLPDADAVVCSRSVSSTLPPLKLLRLLATCLIECSCLEDLQAGYIPSSPSTSFLFTKLAALCPC